jgi:hypothetical protein
MPKIRMFHGHRDDVIVEAEYPRPHEGARTIWLLYGFDGERLVEAVAFRDEREARCWSRRASS